MCPRRPPRCRTSSARQWRVTSLTPRCAVSTTSVREGRLMLRTVSRVSSGTSWSTCVTGRTTWTATSTGQKHHYRILNVNLISLLQGFEGNTNTRHEHTRIGWAATAPTTTTTTSVPAAAATTTTATICSLYRILILIYRWIKILVAL